MLMVLNPFINSGGCWSCSQAGSGCTWVLVTVCQRVLVDGHQWWQVLMFVNVSCLHSWTMVGALVWWEIASGS